MNLPLLRMFAIFLLGLSAPFWWTFATANMIFGIYHFAGSDGRPTALFAWASILIPNILLGLAAGYALARLSDTSVLKGWGLFGIALVGGVLVSVLIEGESIASLSQLFSSPGNAAFLLATTIFPVGKALHRKRRTLSSGSD